MLKYRIYTALVLIPFILILIFFVPFDYFGIVSGLVVTWAAWEWSYLVGFKNLLIRILYLLFILAIMLAFVLIFIFSQSVISNILAAILSIAFFLAWIWAIIAIIFYAKGRAPLGFQHVWVRALIGPLVLVPFFFFALVFKCATYNLILQFGLCVAD